MQPSNAKYAAFAVHDNRQSQRTTSRTCAVSWVIACLLAAVPLPAFAEVGPDKNKDLIEFSSDGGTTFGYMPLSDTDGFDANDTHAQLRSSDALLPTIGKDERFSLRYRMKVK
jgi:hypothetical protein